MAPTTTHQQGSAPPPFTPHPTAQAHPHARLLIPPRTLAAPSFSPCPAGNGDSTMQSQHSAITAQRNHPPPVPSSSNRGTAPPPSAAKTSQPHSFLLPGGKPKTHPLQHPFTPRLRSPPSPSSSPTAVTRLNVPPPGAPRRNVHTSSHPPLTPRLYPAPAGERPPALHSTRRNAAKRPTTAPPLSPRSLSYPGVNHHPAPPPPTTKGGGSHRVSFQFIPPCARTRTTSTLL